MSNVFDVAKYILTEIGGDIPTMKLQKLCFYSYVDYMKTSGKQLFNEKFEAWSNGPVCRELFRVHKGKFFVNSALIKKSLTTGRLSNNERNSINGTLETYGKKTGAELSELSHSESPWINARRGIPLTERCTNVITIKSIKEFYGCGAI